MTSTEQAINISKVSTPQDLQTIAILFKAYALSLEIDLSFQDFSTELSTLPGKYAPPTGVLLLARNAAGEAIGCVALRPLSPGVCEMKRLHVDPRGRGLGVGRALAEAVIREAQLMGYQSIVLDTLSSMTQARRLYESLGFVETQAYYETPFAETVFLRLDLTNMTNNEKP